MPQVNIINKFGKLVGWNSASMTFWGRTLEGIVDFEYNDNVDIKNSYGAGGYPVGEEEGNYEATFSFSVYSEELVAMQKSIPPGLRLQDAPPAPAVVTYELNALIIKDIIQNVRIKNVGKGVKQGDGKITHKFECKISHIDWNV